MVVGDWRILSKSLEGPQLVIPRQRRVRKVPDWTGFQGEHKNWDPQKQRVILWGKYGTMINPWDSRAPNFQAKKYPGSVPNIFVSPSHTWFSFIFLFEVKKMVHWDFNHYHPRKNLYTVHLFGHMWWLKRTILTIYDPIFVHLPPLLMFKIPRSWFIESHKVDICEDYKHLVPDNAGSGKFWPFSPPLGTYWK